jgi:glycosyltransferase involved in cell wall biosynthesis
VAADRARPAVQPISADLLEQGLNVKVAIASIGWSNPTTSMHSHSADALAAVRSVGVDAVPMPLRSYRGAKVGGLLIPWALRTLGSYPAREGAIVHQIDQDSFRGVDVVTVQDLYCFHESRFVDRFFRGAVRTAASRAHRVVVTTEASGQELGERFPGAKEKIRVVPLPHEPTSPDRLEQKYDALWIGRNAPNKGLLEFIALASRFPQLRFAVRWSRSPGRPLLDERLSHAIQLSDNIQVFTQPLSDEDIDALYRSSRSYVSTSTYEGWHLPVSEAYLRGCHIVVPQIEPYVSIYPGGTAFWYEPANRASLDAAFETAVATPFRLPSEEVVRYMSYENVGTRLKAVYEEISRQ